MGGFIWGSTPWGGIAAGGSAPSGTVAGSATVQNVLDAARTRLNDVDISGGTFAANSVLMNGPFQQAYRRVANALNNIGASRLERTFYCTVPAYTNLLIPYQVGLYDLDEPEYLMERGSLSSSPISTTSADSPIVVVTSSPHGLSTNADAVVSGVSGTQAPMGRWYVTVVDPQTLRLNGSYSDGLEGTGGAVSWTQEKFTLMGAVDRPTDHAPSAMLVEYQWSEGAFKFIGATQDRQLMIVYWATGNPPTNVNAVLGWNNAIDVMACLTAQALAQSKGWPALAAALWDEAMGPGPSRSADGTGGLMRDFLAVIIRSKQREVRSRPPYSKRTRSVTIL